jgi:hypothetical protein
MGAPMKSILLATVTTLVFAQGVAVKTGPAVGKKIPAFEAKDQNGKTQTLKSLSGPKGLVLLFVRSADW